MSHPTKLAEYLSDSGTTHADLARKVGADRSQIYRCASGERGPSVDLAVAIEEATGGKVPVSSWAKGSKKARRHARRLAKPAA